MIRRVLHILRFALGAILFMLFVYFAWGKGGCISPAGSISTAYIGFGLIAIVLFAELGYVIVRTRAMVRMDSETKIIARAGAFLVDSVTVMLGTVTAFAVLYMLSPVIQAECVSGNDALYFSMVTFTTLGYGDLVPSDRLRIVAAGQALLGYMTLGLIVGYAGSLFSSELRKQQ